METYSYKIGAMEPMGPIIMQFGGSIGLLGALARYLVIFSHIGRVTM